jgi:hypothetical protein
MVTPSWGSFPRPNQEEVINEENEVSQEIPGEIIDQEKPEAEKPQWGNFQTPTNYQKEPDPTVDEGFFDYAIRNALQYTSRGLEQIAGQYGNIEKFAKDTLANVPERGGFIGEAISEYIGKNRWERLVRGPPGQTQTHPTSAQLRQASEELSGGYTSPKTKGEAKVGELVEDIASATSGQFGIGRIPTAANSLLIPAAANATKEIVEGLGFGNEKAQQAKAAVWLPLSLAFNVNGPAYASSLMNEGRQGIPNTVQMNVPRFLQRLDAVERSPLMINSDPRSALARTQIAALRQDVAQGQTNSQSIMTMYDGVNAAKRNRGLFELNRADRTFATARIDEVRHAVRDELFDAAHAYPEALGAWQSGVTAWAVIHRSNSLTNWIESIAKGSYAKLLTGPVAALFGVGTYGGIKAPLVAGVSSAAIPAAYKTGQILYRMWQDPNLARYYWGAINGATAQNLPSFINNYEKLDKEVKKLESAKPKSKTKK